MELEIPNESSSVVLEWIDPQFGRGFVTRTLSFIMDEIYIHVRSPKPEGIATYVHINNQPVSYRWMHGYWYLKSTMISKNPTYGYQNCDVDHLWYLVSISSERILFVNPSWFFWVNDILTLINNITTILPRYEINCIGMGNISNGRVQTNRSFWRIK